MTPKFFTRLDLSAVFTYFCNGVNQLYTSGLVHCYKLDESICHFRGVGSILSLLFYF